MTWLHRVRARRPGLVRVGIVLGSVALIGALLATVDLHPGWKHLHVALLTGPEEGNYHRQGTKLAERAATEGGRIAVASSEGSADNLAKLAAARRDCSAHFALVQDGVATGPEDGAALVARLPKSESLFLLGRSADRINRFADLRAMKVGAGPAGSGTDRLVRVLFADEDLASLGVVLENHGLNEQLDRVERGDLDLGAFVMDEDAPFIRDAVRGRGLEMATFAQLDVVARKYDFLWHGRIGAGQYDPVRLLPSTDKRVLRVDTLVVTNGCASHAQVVAMLSVLASEIPGLVEHNRDRPSRGPLPLATAARSFFDNRGADLAETYVPWLVDIMPPSNWASFALAISVLFNLMGLGHRFRLWRIDAGRVKADQNVRELLGVRLTPAEIEVLHPGANHLEPKAIGGIDAVLEGLEALRARCRKQSLSMLVPMGQEMAYRYQEDQIEELLTALRRFRARLGDDPRRVRPAVAEA